VGNVAVAYPTNPTDPLGQNVVENGCKEFDPVKDKIGPFNSILVGMLLKNPIIARSFVLQQHRTKKFRH